jgi:hypothetical protein
VARAIERCRLRHPARQPGPASRTCAGRPETRLGPQADIRCNGGRAPASRQRPRVPFNGATRCEPGARRRNGWRDQTGPGRRRRNWRGMLARLDLVPAIPTTGLAWSGGIIPAVRINGTSPVLFPGGRVSTTYIPNVGMARTIGQILVIQLLGHRRTCRTSPTGPMVRLNPATGMA